MPQLRFVHRTRTWSMPSARGTPAREGKATGRVGREKETEIRKETASIATVAPGCACDPKAERATAGAGEARKRTQLRCEAGGTRHVRTRSKSHDFQGRPAGSIATHERHTPEYSHTDPEEEKSHSRRLCATSREMRALSFGRWRILSNAKLGSGHFGTVLLAEHAMTGELAAVKLEKANAKRPRLPIEAAVYRALDGKTGFPRMRWFGRAHGRLALVLDLLGPSLRSVQRQAAGNVLNPLALQHVAKQSLLRLEALHDTGWLHCDVKPANLLLPQPPISHDMGGDSDARGMSEHDVMQQHAGGSRSDECDSLPPLSLVDFGLSRRWRDPESHKHLQAGSLPTRRAGAPVGTGRFASLRNHAGAPLSRRDDLEALAFSLVWLRVGNLPWNGLMPPPALKAERFAAMLECKRRVGASELSVGMPHGFERFFRSVRDIDFEERPDYCGLATMLQPET